MAVSCSSQAQDTRILGAQDHQPVMGWSMI